MYFSELFAITDIATVRNTAGGKQLSAELVVFLALTVYDDYLLFPSAKERSARGLGLS